MSKPGTRRWASIGRRAATGGAVLAATAAGGLAASAALATPTASAPDVRLHDGREVAPKRGDWEGTVNGLPASFELVSDPAKAGSHQAPYGIDALVALQPNSCPPSAAHVTEVILQTSTSVRLGSGATLGLSRLGLGGELTGAAQATLTRSFRLAGCHGTEVWHMHPAVRSPVDDGAWTVHYADGVTGRFKVEEGGRLVKALPLTSSLDLCDGLTGTSDLFVGGQGRADAAGAELKVRMTFHQARATGHLISSGSGCRTHRIDFTATHAAG